MTKHTYTTRELMGIRVADEKKPDRKVGKVHAVIFHPNKRKVIGFTVKRPDVALMFHRRDIFVALDAFKVHEGHILISDESQSTGRAACKRLGVVWEECIIWQGLPLLTEAGDPLGYVGDIRFDAADGSVIALTVDRGKSAEVLLGVTEISADSILGFKLGVGDRLCVVEGDEELRGAIIVAPEALALQSEGGVAEKAGAGYAVAADKMGKAVDKVKPVASATAHKAGEAVNEGAYKVGVQLSKTKGMFSSFKEEYRKARYDEEEKHD